MSNHWFRHRSALSLAALTGALVLAACGTPGADTIQKQGLLHTTPGKDKPAVTLGDESTTEEHILGQLYAQALEARGYTVSVESDMAPSAIDDALASHKVDFYPAYTGMIYQLAENGMPSSSAQQTYQAAAQYEKQHGATTLHPTLFEDVNRVATTNAFANAHGLLNLEDLGKLPSFTFGAPPEAMTQFAGLVGLRQVYGLTNAMFKAFPQSQQYQALTSGQVDTIETPATDGHLAQGSYMILSDPKSIFGFNQEAPVVSDKVLTYEGPQFVQTLNSLSAILTDQAMQTMNAAVDLDHQDPAAVASHFLMANRLE